jgi:hypothetical protein
MRRTAARTPRNAAGSRPWSGANSGAATRTAAVGQGQVAASAGKSLVWGGTTQRRLPAGSRRTHQVLTRSTRVAPRPLEAIDFSVDIVGLDVDVEPWTPLAHALHEDVQTADAAEIQIRAFVIRVGTAAKRACPEAVRRYGWSQFCRPLRTSSTWFPILAITATTTAATAKAAPAPATARVR